MLPMCGKKLCAPFGSAATKTVPSGAAAIAVGELNTGGVAKTFTSKPSGTVISPIACLASAGLTIGAASRSATVGGGGLGGPGSAAFRLGV